MVQSLKGLHFLCFQKRNAWKRISAIEKKKTRSEERIKVLTEENITLSSNLKLLNQKKELLEKMEVDLQCH